MAKVEIELSRENIKEWKKAFDNLAEDTFGENYSENLTDEQLLEMYEGETASDAVQVEKSYI